MSLEIALDCLCALAIAAIDDQQDPLDRDVRLLSLSALAKHEVPNEHEIIFLS